MKYIGSKPTQDYAQYVTVGNSTAEYNVSKDIESASDALVFVGGAIQRPGIDYDIVGGLLTFSENIQTGHQIIVHPLFDSRTLLAPVDSSVTFGKLSPDLIATPADVEERTRNDLVVTPASLNGFPFMKHAMLPDIPVVIGGEVTHTNPLGAIPTYIRVTYECIVSEHGYAVGEIFDPMSWRYTAQNWGEVGLGFREVTNSTIVTKFGTTRVPNLANPLTGALVTMTAARWVAKVHLFL